VIQEQAHNQNEVVKLACEATRKQVDEGQRVCLALTGGDIAAATAAVDLVRQLRGTLTAYFVPQSPDPYAFAGFSGPGASSTAFALDMLFTLNATRESAARQAFLIAEEKSMQSHGLGHAEISSEWGSPVADVRALARIAELADFVVMAKPAVERGGLSMALFDAVLYRARRSVLLVPEQSPGLKLNNVLIAYNGSPEGARAATMALPILRRAQTVTVVTIGRDGAATPSPTDLVAYLQTHNICAGLLETTGHGTVETEMQRVLFAEKPDLLVMGAYSHTQLRHLILGGLTSYMLEHAKLPILFAH